MTKTTIDVKIDEGVVLLVTAAYRLGRRDPEAKPPDDILLRCVRLIQSGSPEETAEIIAAEFGKEDEERGY